MFYTLHKSIFYKKTPAVFLDRDGTINVEKNYLYRYEDWEWIGGAKAAIKSFNDAGLAVVIISNQAGIARGFYSPEDVDSLHQKIQEDLKVAGARIDAFFYCPHHPDFGIRCACRKPSPMMIETAAHELNLDLASSWMIGDKLIDVQAGAAANVKSFLVRTGYGSIEAGLGSDICVFDSIVDASEFVMNNYVGSGI